MSDPSDLGFAGIAALSKRLRARELSPVELTEACLSRADALAPALACFALVTRERALAGARAADAEMADGRWRGPLHGIPYVLADVVDAKGVPLTLGLPGLAGRTPERDATVVARLADHGAILLGIGAAAPLAGALPAAASPAPPCRSPYDPAHSLGGPSPGPACAVGAGLAPLALTAHGCAPDSAAAACGVTSLRPTYGVLSRRGATLASYGLASLGLAVRTAEDAALVLDAIAGIDPRDPSSVAAPPALARVQPHVAPGLRVGVLAIPPAQGELADAFAAAQETLRGAGALLAPASLAEIPWMETAALLEAAEAEVIAGSFAPGVAPAPSSSGATAADYVRAARLRAEAQRAIGRLLERHDLLLAPAPAEGEAPDPLSALVALGGLPALTFPAGAASGRPLGARLVAPPFDEARLLAASSLFQARTTHHLPRPPAPPQAAPVAVTRR
jgi:aspartyl-tRNA(Asn)/glutamyl-tRNA(Gln) amidotransferase subunit A